MQKRVDPQKFGLPRKTLVEQINKKHFAIVINRKSRVIMSDGKKILDKAAMIRKREPDSEISLKITGPICRKTKKFLAEHGIALLP